MPAHPDTLDLGDGRTVAVLEVGRRYVIVKDQGRRVIAITRDRFDALTTREAPAKAERPGRPLVDDTAQYDALCEAARRA